MCVLNSITPLSLKPGGGSLAFFPAVSRGPHWGCKVTQFILPCLRNWVYFVPVQNNKNNKIQNTRLFVCCACFYLNEYIGPALYVCCSGRAQVVLRNSRVLLSLSTLYIFTILWAMWFELTSQKSNRKTMSLCTGFSVWHNIKG